ncbi:uncharacterized protein ARMOST_21032 [Armillaria ostoyae]|uniref:Uncharacterized protein n=1 Tax=Armillaria ostoyae TaxID=47428 RepID=A0A284S927_ARMOS|nr:uncharacterized protein ARMOST_21032 [Armillaria ostoyae]
MSPNLNCNILFPPLCTAWPGLWSRIYWYDGPLPQAPRYVVAWTLGFSRSRSREPASSDSIGRNKNPDPGFRRLFVSFLLVHVF